MWKGLKKQSLETIFFIFIFSLVFEKKRDSHVSIILQTIYIYIVYLYKYIYICRTIYIYIVMDASVFSFPNVTWSFL